MVDEDGCSAEAESFTRFFFKSDLLRCLPAHQRGR